MVISFIETIESFKEKKVAVIGDILLDVFMFGEVERVNPEQPASPLIKILKEEFILGGAANVAHNVSKLGTGVSLYGLLGNDMYSQEIAQLCKKHNVDLNGINIESPTIAKHRLIAHGQQIARFDTGERNLGEIEKKIYEDILEKLSHRVKEYDIIVLSDYDKHIFSEFFTREIVKLGQANNLPVIAAPKPRNTHYFNLCDLICQNKNEAESFTGVRYSNGLDTLVNMGKVIHDRLKPKYVVITCGADGAFSYHNGDTDFIPTVAREVSDVTGAGDTFLAALSLGIAANLSVHDSARLANYASGVAVGKVGTHAVSSQELMNYINRDNHNNK